VKKILIVLLISLILTGCFFSKKQNDNKIRFYLSDKYYHTGEFVKVDNKSLEKLNKENFILFTYNPYCNLPISCEKIFEEFMKKYNIDFISISFSDFKETSYYDNVKYAPSVMIIKEGEVIDYLDANDDKDLQKYQDAKEFEKWLDNYVYFGK
jgi:hypothetical protein